MKSPGGDDGKLPKTEQQADLSFVSRQHTIPDLASYLVTQCGYVQCCRGELHAGKDCLLLSWEKVFPVAYKSWGKIIPLEISLEQVTRYLEMFKHQKYLVKSGNQNSSCGGKNGHQSQFLAVPFMAV